MVRKRAPGGGRKPKGLTAARSVTVRMPDDVRADLEVAIARRPGRTLTDELVGRLRRSFSSERDAERNPGIRAICFLIAELAGRISSHPEWHQDRATFEVFKLATAKLLTAIEPKGETSKVSKYLSETLKLLYEDFSKTPRSKTPSAMADFAVQMILFKLFDDEPAEDWEAAFRAGPWIQVEDGKEVPAPPEALAFGRKLNVGAQRYTYAISDVRRDLKLTPKPKKTRG